MFEHLVDSNFPKMVTIRQHFSTPSITNIKEAVTREFHKPAISSLIRPGARIALLVGSRGIGRIDEIVKAAVRQVKDLGGVPFIVPAMGSHGGATAEGQIDVLTRLGVTEEAVGAPIISSMEPVELGLSSAGLPVYFDKNAAAADGIIPIARVKAHTAFRYKCESGMIKMLTIGAGKQMGASTLHSMFSVDGFGPLLYATYLQVCSRLPVLFGLAIVENAYDQPAIIEAVLQKDIEYREPELLKKAFEYMPKIPFKNFDVLIVDEIGKNISGDGMDPNVTGRYATAIKGDMNYQRLVVLNLTPETHGNALGIGMADVTTRKLVSQIDYQQGYMNAFTSKIVMDTVKVPMTLDSDKEAIAVALKTCVAVQPGMHKVVRIKNTLHLGELEISDTLLPEAKPMANIDIVGSPAEMKFDAQGNLI